MRVELQLIGTISRVNIEGKQAKVSWLINKDCFIRLSVLISQIGATSIEGFLGVIVRMIDLCLWVRIPLK